MFVNLRDVDEFFLLQLFVGLFFRFSSFRFFEYEINRVDEVEVLIFFFFFGKLFIMGVDEVFESELGFGELVGFMVVNEVDLLIYDIVNNKDVLRKIWNFKFMLRSYFDGI